MTTLCFIRHGETQWNQQTRIQGLIDLPLNENGFAQAHSLATYFKSQPQTWDIIASSPLKRAIQTAEVIADTLALKPIIIVKDFHEREFGAAEGEFISKKLFDKIIIDAIEGLEPTKEIQKRVYEATINLANQYPNQSILIVAHSHVIKALLTMINKRYSFRYKIVNSALTTFTYHNNKLKCTTINQLVT